MPIQQPVQSSRVHRWAYVCGMSVKRGYRRLKTFESRVVERAETVGMPADKILVRGSFLAAKLALLGAFIFVSFWLFMLMCTIVVLAAIPIQDSDTPGIDDIDDPVHRTESPRVS